MAAITEKGGLFPEALVKEVINNVKGTSALATLSGAEPIAFNGQREFTFSMDKEVDIVAESGKMGNGGITLAPVTILPVKMEYGARISDEFLIASEEEQIEMLAAFSDGFQKKLARGLDIAAIHGVNPRTGNASTVVGDNNFASKISQKVSTATGTADDQVEAAVALVDGTDFDVTGMAMSKTFKSALAALKLTTGEKRYPELAWGAAPSTINGLPVASNSTLSKGAGKIEAVVGDFANAFKWGFAKEMPLEIIQYGNPDNDAELGDLKGHGQIYVRAQAYIGWGILAPQAFAVVEKDA